MNQGHWKSARTCVFNVGYKIVWSAKYRRKVLGGDFESACKNLVFDNRKLQRLHNLFNGDHAGSCSSVRLGPLQVCPRSLRQGIESAVRQGLWSEFPEMNKKLGSGDVWIRATYRGAARDVRRETVARYIALQQGHEE
jgi:REP element-mobilizing transposase RayT